MASNNGAVIQRLDDEDTEYVVDLARAFYLHFCQVRGYAPQQSPYAPAWALDYARIAIRFAESEGPHVRIGE